MRHTKEEVVIAIASELDHQERIGHTAQAPKASLFVMAWYLYRAVRDCLRAKRPNDEMDNVRKVVAIGYRMMMNHGAPPRTRSKMNPLPGQGGKEQEMAAKSILQGWVHQLTLRQQGVLIMALRGPDGLPKEHPSKNCVRTLRGSVLVAAWLGRPLATGEASKRYPFMRLDLIADPQSWAQTQGGLLDNIDQYNLHFFQHFVHAAAICGYHHPDDVVRGRWRELYLAAAKALHFNPETQEQIDHRLRDGVRSAGEDE